MYEPQDIELVGLTVPIGDEAGVADMARCFVEEFGRIGFTEEGLLALFRNPFYRGPYAVYQQYGEDWVRALIRRTTGTPEEGERG